MILEQKQIKQFDFSFFDSIKLSFNLTIDKKFVSTIFCISLFDNLKLSFSFIEPTTKKIPSILFSPIKSFILENSRLFISADK